MRICGPYPRTFYMDPSPIQSSLPLHLRVHKSRLIGWRPAAGGGAKALRMKDLSLKGIARSLAVILRTLIFCDRRDRCPDSVNDCDRADDGCGVNESVFVDSYGHHFERPSICFLIFFSIILGGDWAGFASRYIT